jgi:hypothetical protein
LINEKGEEGEKERRFEKRRRVYSKQTEEERKGKERKIKSFFVLE